MFPRNGVSYKGIGDGYAERVACCETLLRDYECGFTAKGARRGIVGFGISWNGTVRHGDRSTAALTNATSVSFKFLCNTGTSTPHMLLFHQLSHYSIMTSLGYWLSLMYAKLDLELQRGLWPVEVYRNSPCIFFNKDPRSP